jgi:hypothetical protein
MNVTLDEIGQPTHGNRRNVGIQLVPLFRFHFAPLRNDVVILTLRCGRQFSVRKQTTARNGTINWIYSEQGLLIADGGKKEHDTPIFVTSDTESMYAKRAVLSVKQLAYTAESSGTRPVISFQNQRVISVPHCSSGKKLNDALLQTVSTIARMVLQQSK